MPQALIARPEGALWQRAKELGVRLIPLRRAGGWDLRAAWRLRRILTGLKPAVLQAHTANDTALAALASWGLPVKLIAMRTVDYLVHGNFFSRWKYARADRVVAVSRAVAQGLAGQEIGRVSVIPPGVDLKALEAVREAAGRNGGLRTRLKESHNIPPDCFLIGFFGALTSQKDPFSLVETARLCREAGSSAHFLLVGEGPLREEITRTIRALDLGSRITLLGFRPDAWEIMAGVGCVAFSSVHEGLPNVALEAMGLGVPVVAMRAGGVEEAVRDGETGFLVPPGDAAGLSRAILRLEMDAELRKRLGAQARRAAEGFSLARMTDQFLDLYGELASDGVSKIASPEKKAMR